ncbi:MAG TPA: FAD:protein FMN transferase [Acidimicrobiales bacterium]|nr:FAD:protein FMN transferase [Acidimicrobiales bacterium]
MSETSSSDCAHHVYHREVDVMGTIVTIDLFGDLHLNVAGMTGGVDAAEQILREADEVFSTWKANSPVSRLRRGELTINEVPSVVHEVLDACSWARRATHGFFDPWSMPGGVDPTGLVKGWAAQRALNSLRELELAGALVNAAGDVASFGGPVADKAFRIGIVRPEDPRRLACVVESPGAVATSGTYQRGNHLINPFTGVAAPTVSATVTGPDLGLSDALATALAISGPAGLEWVSALDDYEGLIVHTSGDLDMSDGFPLAERFIDR